MDGPKLVDLSDVRTMEAFHEAIAATLAFPDYYGRNLDALWDCLTDDWPGLLILRGWSAFEAGLPSFATSVRAVLDELEMRTRQLPAPFAYKLA